MVKTWVQCSRRRRCRNRKPGPKFQRGSGVVDVVDGEVEIGERESGSAEGATKDVREESGDGW